MYDGAFMQEIFNIFKPLTTFPKKLHDRYLIYFRPTIHFYTPFKFPENTLGCFYYYFSIE